jgi:hypothetical protein
MHLTRLRCAWPGQVWRHMHLKSHGRFGIRSGVLQTSFHGFDGQACVTSTCYSPVRLPTTIDPVPQLVFGLTGRASFAIYPSRPQHHGQRVCMWKEAGAGERLPMNLKTMAGVYRC